MVAVASATRRVPAGLIAALLAVIWLLAGPRTPDLAAAVYRASLFARHGWELYDTSWYGGHHILGYSILFPAIASAIGVRLTGVLAATASALIFERLVVARWGAEARLAAVAFAVAALADLIIGRITFGLGVTVGLASLYALQRRHGALATLLAIACSATSPVAGLFLALVASSIWLANRGRRAALAVAIGAFATVIVLTVAFPEGGAEPTPFGPLVSVLCFSAVAAVLVGGAEREIRIGSGLYAVAAILTYVVPSPMGSNISRLGAEFVPPLLIAVLAKRPRVQRAPRAVLVCTFIALAGWQWLAPTREVVKVVGDPSVSAVYYTPLIGELRRETSGADRVRIEVPFTRAHWEAVYLASSFPLARGWETQLDIKYDDLFYNGSIDAANYHAWLLDNAVGYVALPDATLDPSSRAEARLIQRGLPYLVPVWRNAHWRLFRVSGAQPLVLGPARLVELGPDHFVLDARAAGVAIVKVHWSRYFSTSKPACVEKTGDGWTQVALPAPGPVRIQADFSLGRLLGDTTTCAIGLPAVPAQQRALAVPAGASAGSTAAPAVARRGAIRT